MEKRYSLGGYWHSLKEGIARIDLGFAVIAALCVLAAWPFISRSSLPQATDAELHIFRLAELSRLVRGGELYPRWAPNFYFGFGYPIFNYYAPLAYQLGLAIELLPKLNAVDAVKVLFIVSLALSGIGIYGFVRDLWGKGAGIVAAASYLFAPYILFIDPHARGDLPEALSFGVFSVCLWALDRLRRKPTNWNWLVSILLTSALILTHNLMSMVFFALLAGWAIWQYVIGGYDKSSNTNIGLPRRLTRARVLLALGLGLLLAAFFWLPVALESDAVNLGSLIGEGGHFDFRNHFLDLGELFGASRILDWGATEPDYALNLGIPQFILGLGGLAALFSRRTRHRSQGVYFLIACTALIFLMIRQSTPFWNVIPMLPFLQFPWRLLGPTAAMLAILGGVFASWVLGFVPVKFGGWAMAGFIALLVSFSFPLLQVPPWPDDFGDTSAQRVLEIERSGRWLGTTSTADFVPASVDKLPKPEPALLEDFYLGRSPDRVNRATLPAGVTVTSETLTPLKTRYHVSADQDFLLRLFLFDFPGWQAIVDGQVVQTELGRPEGFLVIPVPSGDHQVEVRFTSTPARTVSYVISALALLAALVLTWRIYEETRTGELNEMTQEPLEPIDDFRMWPSIVVILFTFVAYTVFIGPGAYLRHESSGMTAYPAEQDVLVNFGNQIVLIGYGLNETRFQPGDQISLALYWKAQDELDINYQVFAHLLGPDGSLQAQSDKLNPGDFPTRRWPIDKYVRDEHTITIPDDASTGTYGLSVGLWVSSDGWRLPILSEEGEQLGDSYILPEIIVVD